MLCESCHQREALVHLTTTVAAERLGQEPGSQREQHLCGGWAPSEPIPKSPGKHFYSPRPQALGPGQHLSLAATTVALRYIRTTGSLESDRMRRSILSEHLDEEPMMGPYEQRTALTYVRPFIFVVFVTLMGCSDLNRPLVFNIRSVDVIAASAEPLDRSRLSVNRDAPDFKAQIHLVFQEEAARRFQRFNEAHPGENFELQVNGQVLLAAVSARPGGGREMWWYTTSMEEAQRFAASLNKK